MDQDAYFTQCLEAICRYMNEMIAVERAKLSKGK